MKIKVFISYSDLDNVKVKMLESKCNSSSNIIPIIVANKREPLVLLTKKVIDGINEADFIIPILTRNSIHTQWINQEIGFSKANPEKIVLPIIEKEIIDHLKGFIHIYNMFAILQERRIKYFYVRENFTKIY